MKIAMNDESVDRGLFERIGVVFVMDEECFASTVEDQRRQTFPAGVDVACCVMDSDEMFAAAPPLSSREVIASTS